MPFTGLLFSSPFPMTAAQYEPTASNPDWKLAGTVVGRFVLRSYIGAGGMGEVYCAYDPKLKRLIALKRLVPSLSADKRYRQRLLTEAERACALDSQHIAAIHDVIEQNGEVFIVMEYVEGENLRERLHRPLSLEQCLDIAVQCSEALAQAHDRGVVHCDIKPENIMLTSSGRIKILDFGVAKQIPRSDQDATLSRTIAGTPAYMAPEMLLEQAVDGRADIFSLGIVLYEALTRHHPFLDDSSVATTQRILHDSPLSIAKFNAQVPQALQTIVGTMLAKAPLQRYASAHELLSDLHACQNFTADKTEPLYLRSSAPVRKRWIASIASILVLVVVGVVAIRRMLKPTPSFTARDWIVVTDIGTFSDDSIPDGAVREGLITSLQQSQYVNVYPRARLYEVLERMQKGDVTRINETLGREICQRESVQVLLTGTVERSGQAFQIVLRALDPSRGTLLFAEKATFSRREDVFNTVDVLSMRVRRDLGESLAGIQRNSRPLAKVTTHSLEALQLYSRATDAMSAQTDMDQVPALLRGALQADPDFAMAHLRLGLVYNFIVSKNESSLLELKRAYDLRQATTRREQLWIEGNYFSVQERYEEEVESLSLLVNLYPDDSEAHQELAMAYFNVGELTKAIAALRETLRLQPFSAVAYGKLVQYLARDNADKESISAYEDAAKRGIDSPYLHWGVGLAYLGQGDEDDARKEFRSLSEQWKTYGDLGELYIARTDLLEGKLASGRLKIGSAMRRDETVHGGGLQLVRRYLFGRTQLTLGNIRSGLEQANLILATPEAELQTNDYLAAGELYTLAGESTLARRVLRRLDSLRKAVPTSWNKSKFHDLEGEIALAEHKPEQAIASFLASVAEYPYFVSHIGLARAYEMQQEWSGANQEWQKVVRARGVLLQDGYPPDLVMAQLGLARTNRRLGNSPLARSNYTEFLRIWYDSDDLPIRRQAVRELAALTEHEQR
jgi:serine/threonine protein kinase/tetratricopeptide (TPR) repeat protein